MRFYPQASLVFVVLLTVFSFFASFFLFGLLVECEAMGNPIPQIPLNTPPEVDPDKWYCVTTQYWQSPYPFFGCTGNDQGLCQHCWKGNNIASLFPFQCIEEAVICCFACPPGVGAEEIMAIIGPFSSAGACYINCLPECIGPP